MLRFTNVVSGTILYDGVDITLVPRKRLRKAITIIPQEAVLFKGTVEYNLDPSGQIPVQRLEEALAGCGDIASFNFRDDAAAGKHNAGTNAGSAVANHSIDDGPTEATPLLLRRDSGPKATKSRPTAEPSSPTSRNLSLSTAVLPKGENFSHGQRQVLSLCRALVRGSRLMLLDEATASMDYETDRGIQTVLRREMATLPGNGQEDRSGGEAGKRTLVTIAHRLRTIVDYDKVVVMGGGRVLEVGTPRELFLAGGTFYNMVKFSGEGEDLAKLMEGRSVN